MPVAADKPSEHYFTQSGKDSQLGDEELRRKYKEIIDTTTLYYRIRPFTRFADWAFSGIENIFSAKDIDAPLQSPIFPLGNFRSGTSFLEKVISDHPAIGYFTYTSQIFPRSPIITSAATQKIPALNTMMLPIHMPTAVDATSPYEGEPIWRWCKNNCWTDYDINILDEQYSDPAFEKLLRRVINKHLISQNRTRFINKNPWNTLRVGYLRKLYPDAIFVYIVRHPHRMLRSQIDLEGVHERTLGHLRHFNEVFSDQFAAPRMFFRTPSSRAYTELYKTDRVLATAMSIVDFDTCFEQEVEKAGMQDQIYRVRYEDLLSSFSDNMHPLFEFLQLQDEAARQVIATNEKKYLRRDLVSSSSPVPRFSEDTEAVLKPMAEKYGYAV